MFTARMVKLFAVVLDHDAEKVTSELLRRGVMHFIDVTRIKSDWAASLAGASPEVPLAKISEMRKRIEIFLAQIDRSPRELGEVDVTERKPLDLDAEMRTLDGISGEQQGIRDRQRTVQQEILRIEEIKRQLTVYGFGLETIKPSQYSFLSLRFGRIPEARRAELAGELGGVPSVLLDVSRENGTVHLLVISMKRDAERVNAALGKAGWEDREIPRQAEGFREDVSRDLEKKLAALQKEQQDLRVKARSVVEGHRVELEGLWAQLRVNELFYRIQSFFKRTAHTAVFSGWLPETKKDAVNADIVRVTAGRCYLEWHEPREGAPGIEEAPPAPVQLKNPRFLAPFQMLVSNFGIPEYGTIDPTPFVVVIYLIMFGLMFADVGQGAVLALTGALGTLFFFKKSDTWRNLSKLMIWCGCASMITGALFGSLFGFLAFEPLWFDFHGIVRGHVIETGSLIHSIFDVLAITVYFGIAVIWLGLFFNWINLAIKRRWVELVLDKGGLLGGWIYGGGIYVAIYMVRHGYKEFPPFTLLFLLVGLPAAMLVMKGPIHFLRERKLSGTPFTFFTVLNMGMDWVVELLEIFSRYLSNTLSFMRVAGLGIAHVSLMTAFFEIASMVSPQASRGRYGVEAIVVILAGNVLVLGLEGLSAGIQSLRLNYYEFFTKFFHGTGELYSPISLKSRGD